MKQLLKHFITKVLEYKVEELNLYGYYVFLSDESLLVVTSLSVP